MALGVLWYNVFAAADAREKLGGRNPYDNSRRLYLGSGNDFWLNLLVDRFPRTPRRSRRSKSATRRPAGSRRRS